MSKSCEKKDLIQAIESLPEEKLRAVKAFMDAVQGAPLEYHEPEGVVYLHDDPDFQHFVSQNKWEERAQNGWKRRTDVFDFIEHTYSDYLGSGLARSSWVDLDNALIKRINQRAYDNRKEGLYLSNDGIPLQLHLPKKEQGSGGAPDDFTMIMMKRAYDAVNSYRLKAYRDNVIPDILDR